MKIEELNLREKIEYFNGSVGGLEELIVHLIKHVSGAEQVLDEVLEEAIAYNEEEEKEA